MKIKTREITRAAVLAAMYVVLTVLQNVLLPGSASRAIQLRLSEALCVFALFSPSAIVGLSVGCLLFNLTYSQALPLDALVGTSATVLATMAMYRLRSVRVFKLPLPALLMPAAFNALLVGWELTFCIGNTFWLNALYVAIGEAAVLLTLGSVLYFALSGKRLRRVIFGE